MKWLVIRQKRRVPWCHYPLECTPVFSQIPAEIPTGHLSGSLSGCWWGDLYQGVSGNTTGIPARVKIDKQNWMKSGFAGSPTNPIFHFHLTFHFRYFFPRKIRGLQDVRLASCKWIFSHVWKKSALAKTLVRSMLTAVCQLSIPSCRWFFAPLPNPHLPSQVFPLITDLINSQRYLVWCANFYFSYFHNI